MISSIFYIKYDYFIEVKTGKFNKYDHLLHNKRTCYVCNLESDQTEISITNTFGSSDLDTRPAEMKRSTITHRVEKCPYCGYRNSSIQIPAENASRIEYSDFY